MTSFLAWSRKLPVIFFIALAWFLLPAPSAAQMDEEMELLRMYYREEELVVSATRNAKPISQVAENMTVVTAEQIEAMNAHTVAEVLNRVPGTFISFNQDFGDSSLFKMQGSNDRHVLVLVDGMSWNFLNSGAAETNTIPVGIIDRIEIIKGPASSAWGSSLGGVVNIITKPVGVTATPVGSISAGYGERNTQDFRAEVAGKAGKVGYYLYAGYQQSDGLRTERYTLQDGTTTGNSRDYDSPYLYGKLALPLGSRVDLDFTIGYSEPKNDFGYFVSNFPSSSDGVGRAFFSTSSIAAEISSCLDFNAEIHYLKQKAAIMNDLLDVTTGRQAGILPPLRDFPAGSLLEDDIFEEEKVGGSANLVWNGEEHTAVFGFDYDYGDLDQTIKLGLYPIYTSTIGGVNGINPLGVQPVAKTSPDRTQWALYANDTILLGKFSVTPGIRYDYNDITGSFTSPSLGITYKLLDHTFLRASVARGFAIPPLSWTDGGGLFLEPNSGLDEENVWSYQAGFESSSLKYLWIKGTFFRHEVDDTIVKVRGLRDTFENGSDSRRQGIELELETLPFYHCSLVGGISYVHFSPSNENGQKDLYEWSLGLRYDDEKSFRAELFGHYVWWNANSKLVGYEFGASYDDIICDFNAAKKVYVQEDRSVEVFFTGHNLFDGSQYELSDSKNPRRWVEGGVRLKF